MRDYGHWECSFDITPLCEGFIYEITNKLTNKKYIGRKQLFSHRSKTVPQKKDPTKTRRMMVVKESDWRKYTGSSVSLNADIKALGKENFGFVILSAHTTKSALNYAEVETLVLRGALTTYLPDGTPAFYNGCIPPTKCRPNGESLS